MINFLILFILGLNHLHFVLSSYVRRLNEEQQYQTYPFNSGTQNYNKFDAFSYGVWSKYLPLSIISQVGLIGMFDSHCFLQNSIIENTNKEINLLYYDCVDPQTNTIEKKVQFLSSDNQMYNYKYEINPLVYENYWYFFGLNIVPSEGSFGFFIFQGENLITSEQLNIQGPFKHQDLTIVIGGGLIVEESQILWIQEIQKLSYFPGKLAILNPSIDNLQENYDNFDYFKYFQQMDNPECISKTNSLKNLPNFDISKLNHEVFASESINCDEFQLETWIQISNIRREDQSFIYQLLKISANFENHYAKNENLSPFQLFYKFSNSQIKLIVTTYSFLFPLVDYDFNKQSFLQQKEWSINNIKLWHFLYVSLRNKVIQIQITFYEGLDQTLYETQFLVHQFHEVQFKLQYGNILKSSTNYLTRILKNMKFSNSASEVDIFQGCHHSCEQCEGPTNKDCLSCSKESKRIYIPQFKVCVCPFDYIDDVECKNTENYNLSLDPEFEYHSTLNCPQGQFNKDGFCLKCPSFIKDTIITCLECIQNPKGWQNDPYCQTNLYIDKQGSPAQYKIDNLKTYYIFDGIDIKPQQLGLYQNRYKYQYQDKYQDQFDSVYLDFEKTNENFQRFYSSSKKTFESYFCNLKQCEICIMLITKQICKKCSNISRLRNGIYEEIVRGVIKKNNCQAPYYITSENLCNLCEIENCQFCFEYSSNDLTKCTLYSEFQTFQKDEFLKLGCALCLDGFIFDFTLGICIYKESTLPNCKRSFINPLDQQLCTLSAIQDFGVAPEITNCQKYISNCKQCIQTPQSIIKCIICEDGYSSSLTTGHCRICQVEYAKLWIEGDFTKGDAWMQQIQSFLMLFLPNKYMYPKSANFLHITPLAIKCIDKYELNQNFCSLYCDLNCVSCKKEEQSYKGFTCSKCIQDYYMEPLRTIQKETCVICPLLCLVCEQRTTEEIQNINPAYEIDDQNRKYTYKCIQKRQHQNIIIDPYQQIAKYCLNGICDQLISYQLYNNCEDLSKIFDGWRSYTDDLNFEYFNQIGAQKLNLIIPIQDLCIAEKLYEESLTNELKKGIFSLFWVELTFLGNHSPSTYQPIIEIKNFDSISFKKLTFIIFQTLELFIINDDAPTNLILTDSKFMANNQDQIIFSIQIKQCQHFEIRNITLSDLNILDSVVFLIRFQNQDDSIKLLNFTIRNCNLTQATLFQFYDFPNNTLIQNFKIENCQFFNSTILSFIQDIKTQSMINIINLIIHESFIQDSLLINGTDIYQFKLVEVSLNLNKLKNSKFLLFQNSLTIVLIMKFYLI
ncbi:unnamed protein product [Paramecium pentaurelia]|uniref:Insulin-like growth factor binding protein, N-terminal n=1 Tax=Paramecium pentaurelia TaxID=43138 RepID=A0A8S1YPD5_9CILI|nr:unnamed protein product [Paramecium pentaurelia]